ncbi:MAG TPA: hypothetical protein VGZ47_11845 [Gemmataceae bacterium]|jgi:hypothetical protein|nr:hypothetical protein [Gemmataceae bacterium]
MFAAVPIVAILLLTAGPAEPLPAIGTEGWPALQASMQRLAYQWQILDPREDRLLHLEELAADLKVLRRRYRELADAPNLHDCIRFPEKALSVECLAFNRAYRKAIEKRLPLEFDQEAALKETLRETDELYKIWDTVRDARCEIYYVPVRRQALKQLRNLIGPEAYYSGHLPPHVPLWRFEEIK